MNPNKNKYLVTINKKLMPVVLDMVQSDFLDNPSQLFHKLVVEDWKRRQGGSRKGGKQRRDGEDTEIREGMVWIDGDDMNPGRWITEEEANLKQEMKTLKK